MGLVLYILLQLAFYGLLLYVGYRYISRKAAENRAASLTEAPDETDYVPEPVTRDFINRVSVNRGRSVQGPVELALAAELVRLNPAELRQPGAAAYDEVVAPILQLLRADSGETVEEQHLVAILRGAYGNVNEHSAGMLVYLRNWFRGVERVG